MIKGFHSLENLNAKRYQDTLFLTCWPTQERNYVLVIYCPSTKPTCLASALEVLLSSPSYPAHRAAHPSKAMFTALPFYKFFSNLSLKQTLPSLFSSQFYFSVSICPFLIIWVCCSKPLLFSTLLCAYWIDLKSDMMSISLEMKRNFIVCLLYQAPKS